MMNRRPVASLRKAFKELAKLPEAEQEAMAAIILEELESERHWDESFAKSKGMIAAMAGEAVKEYREGKTLPFESDSDLSHD